MTPLLTWVWPQTLIDLAIVIGCAIVTRELLVRLLRRWVRTSIAAHAEKGEAEASHNRRIFAPTPPFSDARYSARITAIGQMLDNVITVTILIVALLTVLQCVGVPMAPIFASAGVIGVALGIGAQNLIKDALAGLFIIIEDQFGIGDLVTADKITGTVEAIGLRVTRVRDADGKVWYLRNGELTVVGNETQGHSTASVSIPVAPDEDPDKVTAILHEVADAAYADPQWQGVILKEPFVAGLDAITPGQLTFKIFADCATNQQWGVQRDLLTRAHKALSDAGVRPALVEPSAASSAS